MALFKILKGDSSRISTDTTPFHDGYAYLTADDGGFYIDAETDTGEEKRILINQKSRAVTTTLAAASWSDGTQTLSIPNLGAEQNGMIGLSDEIEDSLLTEAKEADLHIASQSAGSLVIEARGTQPAHDLPVVVVLFA